MESLFHTQEYRVKLQSMDLSSISEEIHRHKLYVYIIFTLWVSVVVFGAVITVGASPAAVVAVGVLAWLVAMAGFGILIERVFPAEGAYRRLTRDTASRSD